MDTSAPDTGMQRLPHPPRWADGWRFLENTARQRMETAQAFHDAAERAATEMDDDHPLAPRLAAAAAAALLTGVEAKETTETQNNDPLLVTARAVAAAFAEQPEVLRGFGRMLQAAEREARRVPVRTWGELLTLGQFARVPLGRAFLAVCGEEAVAARRATDALFLALFAGDRLGRIDAADAPWRPAAADGGQRLLRESAPLRAALQTRAARAAAASLGCAAAQNLAHPDRSEPRRFALFSCRMRGRLELIRPVFRPKEPPR